MRGEDERGGGLSCYVDMEARVPADHPLRATRVLVDEALVALSADFAVLYATTGRPSIAPEKLLRPPVAVGRADQHHDVVLFTQLEPVHLAV